METIGNGVLDFIKEYPGMSLRPSKGDSTLFKGTFHFVAKSKSGPEINDSYELKIEFPDQFPKVLPKVWEIKNKIPRDGEFHINPDDTLCLGSPIRLLKKANNKPTPSGFAESCIVPFLYAVSRKIDEGGDFYMGELEHGEPGIVEDYKDLFGLNSKSEVLNTLKVLSMKKRIANKKPCPCNCGQRLGVCKLRLKVNQIRKIAARSWFKRHAASPGASI